jgi:tRNA A-37 threonylcarbamoyl transferase component Bud32/tetratricopeptide (TPR) repeat protein
MPEPLTNLTAALSGRYEILRELGAGGMATVYLARDVKHDRQVALKVLRPDLAATLGPERFLNEIRIAANLTHPHILPVHDSGEAGGFLYYVMPYIQGESLRDKLEREGELPVAEATRILRDVADALAAAHAAGVVHRDIKPDNVLISGRHAMVMDFGVAKAVSEATGRQEVTTAGVALGTPQYMAPEQAVADPHIDHRADIYALGVLGYELLTGRPPFAGATSQQVLTAHVTVTPDPVTAWRPSVPPALEQIVARCLEKKPADRWQRSDELVPLLEALSTPSGGITPAGTLPVEAVGTMSLAGLVRRVGWRRLGRTLAVYLVASLAVLQGVTFLMNQFGLPHWFLLAGVVLLLMGLPIILTTALITAAGVSLQGTTASGAAMPWRASRRWFTWRRAILGGLAAFAALATVGSSLVWSRNRGVELEPDVVAVLPFRLVGSDIGLWREGLVDLLSTALDGTGRLRASDPRAVMNAWRKKLGDEGELPEPDVAAEVPKVLKAGLMIQGSVVSTGPGEVRVTADLYNVRWLRKEGSVVVDGPEGDMASLVDRLSVDLLKSIWRTEEIPEIRVSSVTTSSVPALRAYLEGEQYFRRSEFVQAREAFTRAIEIDSTFAIAAHRLSIAYGWSAGSYAEEHLRYAALAARHLSGLPVRDSLLILGHKLVDFDGDLDVIPIYQRLTSSYPDDFEAWDGEGEAYWHLGAQAGYGPKDVVDALAHGYAVDSTMAPSLIHLVQSANAVGDSTLVREWTARYLAIDSTSPQARAFRLAAALRFGPPTDAAAAAAALATVDRQVLGEMGSSFAYSGVTGLPYFERVFRAASDPRFPYGFRASALRQLGEQYLRHGQVARWLEEDRQAATVLGRETDLFVVTMARIAGVAQDSASVARFERLARQASYPDQAPNLAFLYAKEGRDAEAHRGVEQFDHWADSLMAEGDTVRARTDRGLALALRGHIAAAHDSAEAAIDYLRRGLRMIRAQQSTRDVHRYLLATLLEGRGDETEALRTYESLFWSPWLEALGYERAGQLHERRGESQAAVGDYERFLALWEDADPQLQPQVEQARAALRRLGGGGED